MTDPTKTPNKADEAKQMTAADAAKRVKRAVIELVDGKDGAKVPRAKQVPVSDKEVLSFRDYGSHVVVVTTDGQKLSSQDE